MGIIFIFLLLLTTSVHVILAAPPICCFPQQFESVVYGISADVDVPDPGRVGYGYGYMWTSGRMAYDSVNQRTFYFEHQLWWLMPWGRIVENYTMVRDYKQNTEYYVYKDGSCDKNDIDESMFVECIPGNATFKGENQLGSSNLTVRHYLFYDRIYLDPLEVTVSVIHSATNFSECYPVRASSSSAYVFQSDHDVDITVSNIVDVTPGIKDPAIFNMPPECKKTDKKETVRSRRKGPRPFFLIFL